MLKWKQIANRNNLNEKWEEQKNRRCSWVLCLLIFCYERNFRLHIHVRLNFHHFTVLQGWRTSLQPPFSAPHGRSTSMPVHMGKDHFESVIQRPEESETAQKKQWLQITKHRFLLFHVSFIGTMNDVCDRSDSNQTPTNQFRKKTVIQLNPFKDPVCWCEVTDIAGVLMFQISCSYFRYFKP